MLIYIRMAEKEDLDQIMTIIDEAKALLKKDGNPQWQNGTPSREMLTEDINLKRAYCLVANKEIAGVAVLLTTPDPNYAEIAGAWSNNKEQYATIHRIAISSKFRGQHLSQFMISNLISRGLMLGIRNFRIDTHAVNKRMQGLIKGLGFEYRGIVQVDQTENGARNAYELNLQREKSYFVLDLQDTISYTI